MPCSSKQIFNFIHGADIAPVSTYDIWKTVYINGNEPQFLSWFAGGSSGSAGLSAYEKWLTIEGNAGKTFAQFIEASKTEEGRSAYQVWLDYGNTGTQAEYLASLKGVKGDTGEPGVKGPVGDKGPTGAKGTPGKNGENGAKGETGYSAYYLWKISYEGDGGTEPTDFFNSIKSKAPKGETGDNGPNGAKGPIGDTGAKGPIGDTGAKGPIGSTGATGKSAYEVWVEAGNTGTQAQYLASLKGANGAKGPTGDKGATGETGAKGATGDAGKYPDILDCLFFTDGGTNKGVVVKNGELVVLTNPAVGITVTTLPNKTDYTDIETFDPTGMVVKVTYSDGTSTVITSSVTYDESVTTGSSTHEIRYVDKDGRTLKTTIPITTRTLEVALQDFTYDLIDGVYHITGWKETLNGEPSTICRVPNHTSIMI